MGLDISAYASATRLDPHECDVESEEGMDECWRKHVHVFAYADFGQSLAGCEILGETKIGTTPILDCGYYAVDRRQGFDFRAGSYSGYGHFRSELASTVLGASERVIWRDPEPYRNRPFFELVHFADNEGCIGPVAARNLHEDFVAHRDKFVGDEYFLASYDCWTEACEIAADTGIIVFH